MAEVLFPKRQRCKACRGNLGAKRTDPVKLLKLYRHPLAIVFGN